MAKHHIKHVRHHAHKHHLAHLTLKEMLKKPLYREKIWHIFLGTFTVVLTSIIIFVNWGKIVNFFTPEPPPALPQVHGFKSGILGAYKIEKQASNIHKNYMAQIPAGGHLAGMQMSLLTGNMPEPEPEPEPSDQGDNQSDDQSENQLENSVWLTNKLSTGQHLTEMEQKTASGFQKSVLATFYLGEKTIDVNSTLQNDTHMLQQINNALSVDLFQYLNQSSDRAGTLDSYLNLLITLEEKASKRINELESKINFLKANSQAQEAQIKLSEEAFFGNLQSLNGPNAEEKLKEFIGIKEENAEVRAKMGAYKGLQDYYKFFQPKLQNLIKAIKANRDPLIAGVKVVEIQNMTLPLIIKEE